MSRDYKEPSFFTMTTTFSFFEFYVFDDRKDHQSTKVINVEFRFHLVDNATVSNVLENQSNGSPDSADDWEVIHVYKHPINGDLIPTDPPAYYGDENLGFVWMVDEHGGCYDTFCKAHADRRRGRCSDEECTSIFVDNDGEETNLTIWDGNDELIDLIKLVQRHGVDGTDDPSD